MADARAFEPAVFSIIELPAGRAGPRELKAAGKARGGHNVSQNFVLGGVNACVRAFPLFLEGTMKSCLGIIIASGLTLPAFGQEGIKSMPEGVYQLNYAKSTIRGPIAKSQTFSLCWRGNYGGRFRP